MGLDSSCLIPELLRTWRLPTSERPLPVHERSISPAFELARRIITEAARFLTYSSTVWQAAMVLGAVAA